MAGVQQLTVDSDEDGMRLDRWFGVHFPQVPFGRVQKLLRTGQIRVDKARAKTNTRLGTGQIVRVPPVDDPSAVDEHGNPKEARKAPTKKYDPKDVQFLRDLIIYEDDEVYVFNKPHGLAVQGGSGTKVHIDGMLKSLPNRKGEAPRLVHRLDRDTSGCLLVAKTRPAASHLGKIFRTRSARKIYWAVTVGVPNPAQGRISCFIARQSTQDGEQMVVVDNGDDGAVHSVSHYSVTDNAGREFSWVTLKPVTGRTHQLRVHMNYLGTPILDDPRYFTLENWNWERPESLGEGLHLHARRISVPMRNGKRLDVTAPLPPHMQKTFNTLGFDARRYDAQDPDLGDD